MGELMDLNPPRAITVGDLPSAAATDAEVLSAIAKTLSVFPRSSSTSIDGNNCLGGAAAGFQWIDAAAPHTNLPSSTGLLIQFDPLFGLAQQGLYKFQLFVGGTSAATQTSLYLRHQNNGAWASWRTI